MIPYSFTATSHYIIIVTFSMSLSSFIRITIIGFKIHGLHFFSFLLHKDAPLILAPLLVVLELVSCCFRGVHSAPSHLSLFPSHCIQLPPGLLPCAAPFHCTQPRPSHPLPPASARSHCIQPPPAPFPPVALPLPRHSAPSHLPLSPSHCIN